MDEGIYKTNVSQASPVFIPLSDPAEKFGDIFKIECKGGGRINHKENKIDVYGHSVSFGVANH